MTEIVTLQPGEHDFKIFESFPEEIYSADSLRFKIHETINNEFLAACFVLVSGGKVQARAALYDNPYLCFQNKKAACIGNYESVNDKDVAAALLSHLACAAHKQGAKILIGPMNGSTWDTYRFSLHHDYPPFFLEPYHHLYYNEHFTHNGFDLIAGYSSGLETDLKYNDGAIAERERELKKDGVTFRNIDSRQFEKELEKIYHFNAVAFRSNFLYTPISKTAFIAKYLETKTIIDPEFVILAEDASDNLIGYFFCIRDIFNTKEKSLIAKTIARHPDPAWNKTGHVMGKMICTRAINKNYSSIIHSFMHEEGTSVNLSKNFSGKIFKNYALYGKEL